MLPLSQKHGKYRDFLLSALQRCLFLYDRVDEKNVEDYLENINTDFNTYMASQSDFILERIKRKNSPLSQLQPAVKLLFDNYGPLPCAKTGIPFLNQKCKRIIRNIVTSIELGKDKKELMKYACSRELILSKDTIKIIRNFFFN